MNTRDKWPECTHKNSQFPGKFCNRLLTEILTEAPIINQHINR